MRWRGLVVVGLLAAPLACDDDPVTPDTGTLVVEAATTGAGTDPDGYTVDLDSGTETEALGVNASVTFNDQDAGDHTVELTGVASNCTVSGDNPRTVTVESGETKTETFSVTCTA